MADNKIPADFLSTAEMATRNEVVPRPSLTSRLAARLRAGRLDRMLGVGVPAAAGSALAAHEARLTSLTVWEAIARSLRRCVADATGRGVRLSSRVHLNVPNIMAAEDLI